MKTVRSGSPILFAALRQTSYIVSPLEVRAGLFYRPIPTDPTAINTTDPAVIAYDNANFADAMTRGFFDNAIAMFTARHPVVGSVAQIKALSKVDQVNVPVFIQLGDNDFLFPAGVAGPEASFYSSAPSVTMAVLSNMGHVFNLHTNHSEGWQQINNWIQNNVVN